MPGPAPRALARPEDQPPPLGVSLHDDGATFALAAAHASAVELCLFDPEDATGASERRISLSHHAHGIWWETVPGAGVGTHYGYRVHGRWDPAGGMRHNPAKLLQDPYAHALHGQVRWSHEIFGHQVDGHGAPSGEGPDPRDSAAYVPRSVIIDHTFDWGPSTRPGTAWTDTVLYEAHVRGLTMLHPDVPEQMRGTYAALGHPAIIEHLQGLGVTALELLPIHTFIDESHLRDKGLTNYWGYNTLGFFAPHADYAMAQDPQGVIDEVKQAVRSLHEAGIEVILDVVYNHTCEQAAATGPMLSCRGIDGATYYRLDEQGCDIDVTGCGNTVDTRSPTVVGMVLDSLRHWVQTFGIDGFRFDLAPALARGQDHGFTPDHPFLVATRTDPVLSSVKLIAEPWDLGIDGWRTGNFPPPWAEWNDRFRDTVRTFWLSDSARDEAGEIAHSTREMAPRLAGSEDLFGNGGRSPLASVNLVAAHDGFTVADLVSYNNKHNQANGEDNRDGGDHNESWNHGLEGPTEDPAVVDARLRSMRNLLATTLLAAGVPMLVAGDEMGRSQRGNNNAYCQDNEISWVNWSLEDDQRMLLEDVRALTALRRRHPCLRPRSVPQPDPVPGHGLMQWFTAEGEAMQEDDWDDPARRAIVTMLSAGQASVAGGSGPDAGSHHADDPALLLVLHAGGTDLAVKLPTAMADESSPEQGRASRWQMCWSSAGGVDEAPVDFGASTTLPARSVTVFTAG